MAGKNKQGSNVQPSGTDDDNTGRIAAAMQSLIEKQGSSEKALELLLTENYELRAKNRTLREQIAEKEKDAPAEGSIILSPEEAKAWEAYKEIGKPEDLKKTVEERDTLKATANRLTREAEIASIAEAHGFNPKVLIRLAGDLEFEVKEIEHEGKKISKTSVIIPSEDGKRTTAVALDEYADKNWKEFIPALKADTQKGSPNGTPFIQQRQGAPATDDKDDIVSMRLRQKQEASMAAPNPLMASVPKFGAGAASETK